VDLGVGKGVPVTTRSTRKSSSEVQTCLNSGTGSHRLPPWVSIHSRQDRAKIPVSSLECHELLPAPFRHIEAWCVLKGTWWRCRRSPARTVLCQGWREALRVRRAGGDPKPPQCHVGQEPGWEATAEKARNQRVRWATRRRTCVNHCWRIENVNDDIETGAARLPRDEGTPFGVSGARELPARGLGGVRCKGAV